MFSSDSAPWIFLGHTRHQRQFIVHIPVYSQQRLINNCIQHILHPSNPPQNMTAQQFVRAETIFKPFQFNSDASINTTISAKIQILIVTPGWIVKMKSLI